MSGLLPSALQSAPVEVGDDDAMTAGEAAAHDSGHDMVDPDNVSEPAMMPGPAPDMAGDPSELLSKTAGTHDDSDSGMGGATLPAALPDTPVYKRPVIEVEVPGLDAPRALGRDAMMKKLDELRQRGLASGAEETEIK